VPNISGERGERIPTVPQWTISVAAETEFLVTSAVGLYGRVDYQYIDGSWSDFNQAWRARLPTSQLLALRAGVRNERWEVEAFVENLLDDRVVFQHVFDDDDRVIGRDALSRPRTLGVRARLEFGRQ
jgi:outer membrane receptor protein involved in Fe transport